ncbi:MAG TPA: tRNA pseudouridine(38-40) synthase TruA [Chitinophagaceae bacterium]|jgi:tRNA pseudouridine38-40 synthase|nr:tRNA pseudouridine(38-40) synthase TruA [Chitinophagaceae bacterium]
MARYFLEVAYKGTNYSGFQIQQNANSIQAEIEKACEVLQKEKITLTSSSRTDAGVHALQNFFHFDFEGEMNSHFVYKINAILPDDIVIQNLITAKSEAHCRFDAVSREYKYFVYRYKNPFLKDRAFYFPYKLNTELMEEAAEVIKDYVDFTSFSKKNTQVKTFICHIQQSEWKWEEDCLVFYVKADRFLRGMVRALVATMLKIGRGKLSIEEFKNIIEQKDCTKASFAVPAHGLFLIAVNYPENYF